MVNSFDIFIIIVISFGLLRGFFRGFIKEISSIVGVIAGFYGAYTYYKLVAVHLNSLLTDWGYAEWTAYGNIASFFLIFFAILLFTTLIANIIRYLLKIVFLKWVDRLFGLLFGATKGILVVSVVFTVLTTFLPNQPEFITKSTLTPYVVHISEMATLFISKDLKGEFKVKIERMKEIWEEQKSAILIKGKSAGNIEKLQKRRQASLHS
ncbi:MAG: CvpA family protein [Desulfamplus sp.]|nr:CvpA family protein [Desulfamplus sp.]MBF0243237.1 CvpA family protein [Desulfamplus sp.]